MAITYNWTIVQLDCSAAEDGQSDVVRTIHFILNGTDGTNSATLPGCIGVTYKPGEAFTPYADLTQPQIEQWIIDHCGEDQVKSFEADVAQQITNITAPIAPQPLPWMG